MNIRIFRKALVLLVVDIVFIIGIFVLQFRTDSNIIEKIGDLQITLEQTENQQNTVSLKNKFNANYKGITIFCDDKKPVQIKNVESQEKKSVQLLDWKKVSDLSCQLFFTDDVSILLSLTSNEAGATLNTIAYIPSGVEEVFVPYNYSYNMKLVKNDDTHLVLSDKKASWQFIASDLSDGYLSFNRKEIAASYAMYNETKKFSFDSITEVAIAEKEIFDSTLDNFKQNLISAFKSNNSESSITEQSVVSYIAAMAANGNYTKAIDDIPQTYKKSKQRTYLSAPYLDTLEVMNAQLDQEIKENEKTIANYVTSGSLDFYNSRDIASHLCVCKNVMNVRTILENAANADAKTLTIAQATGILQTFVDLSSLNTEYAKILLPILSDCVERITDACAFDGSVITMAENDTFLSVIQAVETGIAILRYGSITGNETLVKAGRVIINSYIMESSSFDLRTLANIYPILAYDNTFYPHYEQIQTDNGEFVWAWTCAKSIFYEKDVATGAITLSIDFPEGYTHYLIIKGIQQFSSIYIYNMAFRTDPRFETYNSSGYVYNANGKTLLLKSRHKTRFETVRLEYNQAILNKQAEEEAKKENAARVEEQPKVENKPEATAVTEEAKKEEEQTTVTPPSDNPYSQYQNQYQQQYQQQYQH